MKVAVYTCMKNEERHIQGWMDSARDADHLVVLDTGSTDRTTSFLGELESVWRRYSGREDHVMLHRGRVDPWRFDVALNTCLALVPPDVDVCVQLAGDERLTGGWRQRLETAWEVHEKYWKLRDVAISRTFKIRYLYQFAPELTFYHDRIHSRFGQTWRYPFHECLVAADPAKEQTAWITSTMITQIVDDRQTPEMAKMRAERDLSLAMVARAEWPHDSRMCFYVGRQLMYAGRYDEALKELMRYPDLMKTQPLFPLEGEWWADAVKQCYQAIGRRSQ